MPNLKNEKIMLIQRRCGERTQDIYLATYRQFRNIRIAECSGFRDALEQTIDMQYLQGVSWVLSVDADIAIYPDFAEFISATIPEVGLGVYEYAFLLDDAITGLPTYGVHLQNTRYMGALKKFLKTSDLDGVKGESKNIHAFLKESRLERVEIFTIAGSHDRDQYLKDIIRKYLIRGLRYRKRFQELYGLIDRNTQGMYRAAALAGLQASIQLKPDTNMYVLKNEAVNIFAQIGLPERELMTEEPLLAGKVRRYTGLVFP